MGFDKLYSLLLGRGKVLQLPSAPPLSASPAQGSPNAHAAHGLLQGCACPRSPGGTQQSPNELGGEGALAQWLQRVTWLCRGMEAVGMAGLGPGEGQR